MKKINVNIQIDDLNEFKVTIDDLDDLLKLIDEFLASTSNSDDEKIIKFLKDVDISRESYEFTEKMFQYFVEQIIEMDNELEDGESLEPSTLRVIEMIKNKQFKKSGDN